MFVLISLYFLGLKDVVVISLFSGVCRYLSGNLEYLVSGQNWINNHKVYIDHEFALDS